MVRFLTVLLAVAALGSAAAVVRGQGAPAPVRPDFSGTWALVSLQGQPAETASDRSRWTSPVTLTQDARTLTLEYVSHGRNHAPVRLVYNLDGSEGKGVDRNAPVSPYALVLRAEWRGARLLLTTVYIRETEGNLEFTEILALDSPATMAVETTRRLADQSQTNTSRWRR